MITTQLIASPPGWQLFTLLCYHYIVCLMLDENAGKAEKLRESMLHNLTMARDRVQDLCK